MNMNRLVQTFRNIVEIFNILEGQNRGLKLDYHIFSGATDTLIYDLEITILATQEKLSLPCYILPEEDPNSQILQTLQLLYTFVQLTTET